MQSITEARPQQLSVQLAELATRINACHDTVVCATKASFENALDAGRLLKQVKATLPHGEYEPWLAAHFKGSVRSAQIYKQLAEGWPALAAKSADPALLTIESALRLLAAPDDLAADVEVEGDIPVTTAARIADLPKSEQATAVWQVVTGVKSTAAPKPKAPEKPKGPFQKMEKLIGQVVREIDVLKNEFPKPPGWINSQIAKLNEFKKGIDEWKRSTR